MAQRALTFCFLSLPILLYCNEKGGQTERELNSFILYSFDIVTQVSPEALL